MENVIPLGKDKNSFARLREAFRFVYAHYKDDFDWILKSNDKSYIVMENLRYLLYQYDDNWPVVIGQRFLNEDYMSGVYAISRRAFTQLIETAFRNPEICKEFTDSEDVNMAKCLQRINVLQIDALDKEGRAMFFANNPQSALFPIKDDDYDQWYWHKLKQGIGHCCSDQLIVVGDLWTSRFYYMEYYMYKVKVFGMKRKIKPLPKKLTLEEVVQRNY